jgi:hypothetical protein
VASPSRGSIQEGMMSIILFTYIAFLAI